MKTPRLLFLPAAMMIAAGGQSQAADNTITVPERDKYAKVDVERTMRRACTSWAGTTKPSGRS